MSERERQPSQKWTWDQVSPLPRCLVAAFGGKLGIEVAGGLDRDVFFADMTDIFRGKTEQELRHREITSGSVGMRSVLLEGLQAMETAEVEAAVAEVGQLAGGNIYTDTIVQQVVLELPGAIHFSFVPSLRELCDLATQNFDYSDASR